MDWQQLTYFRATARAEHMSRAAEELAVSQSTLSRSIARLEQQYGVPLFDRIGRGLRLNPYGKAFLARVERALQELEDGERELAHMAGLAHANITLGFLATFATRIVPRLIGEFRTTHPDVQFRLLQGPAPILRERLLSGDIDVCLSSPRFADVELAWEPLWDEELIAIVPPGHARADSNTIALSDLALETMVALKAGYGLRQNLDEFARLAGFTPRIGFEGDEVATLVGLVGAGFGVALVPKGVELGVAVPLRIEAPVCFRTIGMAWPEGRYSPPLLAAFRAHVLAELRARPVPTNHALHAS